MAVAQGPREALRAHSQGGQRWPVLTCLDFSSWRSRTSLLSTRVRAWFSRKLASRSWLWSMACSVERGRVTHGVLPSPVPRCL